MRGCIQRAKLSAATMKTFKKGEARWRLILSLGKVEGKWKQRWVTFTGSRKQAEAKLSELLGEVDRGEFIEPSKTTVGAWLDHWLETAVKPPQKAVNTYKAYKHVIDTHLKPALGAHLVQRLTPSHIERHYSESKLSPRTMTLHHNVLTAALKAAVARGDLLRRNPAERVMNKPRVQGNEDDHSNVWDADEARQFLEAVKQTGNAQQAALFAVALDGGLRNGELLGLQWKDIDFTSRSLGVERQLMGWSEKGLVTSLPKGKRARSLDLSEETITLLKEHKRQQAELKMANRLHYEDHGLMFAQAWEHQGSKHAVLGGPLYRLSIGTQLEKLCKAAGVKCITTHGLRHTCATLLLKAGVQPHVVQRRLGHLKVEITLNIYSHALPSMQQDAASRLAALLHG